MNRIKRMKRRTIAAIAVVFFLGLAGYASAQIIPPPPPGQDTFESLAQIGVEITAPGLSIDIDVQGPTTINRGPADREGIIRTQIVSMNLKGGGTAAGTDDFFDVTVNQHPNRPSTGVINARTGDSFFDVFVRISVEKEGEQIGVFENTQPVRLQAKISTIPPIETAYVPPRPVRVPLVDSAGRPVGFLTHVQHVPAQPSHAKLKRELILIEKKLDRLRGAPRATLSPYLVGVWQLRDFPNFFSPSREDTLFTIINPTAEPLAVQVKILDDRENAIACGRVRPPLTPSDMVEVNVRQFLVLNGVPIPPTNVGVVQAVSFLPPGPPENARLKAGIVGYLKNFITDGDDPADTLSPFDRALNVISHAKEELKPVPDKDLNLRQFLTCPPGRTFDIPSHPTGSSKTKDGSSTGVAMKRDVESHKVKSEAKN